MATDGATITMSMREADRLKTVQAVVDGALRGLWPRSGRLRTARKQRDEIRIDPAPVQNG